MKKYNIKVWEVRFFEKAMVLSWEGNIGWGELVVMINDDGSFLVDTECMGKEFAQEVINAAGKYILSHARIV